MYVDGNGTNTLVGLIQNYYEIRAYSLLLNTLLQEHLQLLTFITEALARYIFLKHKHKNASFLRNECVTQHHLSLLYLADIHDTLYCTKPMLYTLPIVAT